MPREGERSQKGSSLGLNGRVSSATWREQTFYLFDIVASLCAGFNEHDIEFLSSLLALLRGDLSAQRGGGGKQIDMERNVKTTGQKREGERGETVKLKQRRLVQLKNTDRKREVAVLLSKHEAGQTLETARLSRIIRRPLQYTNLFDVIASLGAGLYVHHIEFASFPLCRLYRDLPATDPGEGGKGGVGRCEG